MVFGAVWTVRRERARLLRASSVSSPRTAFPAPGASPERPSAYKKRISARPSAVTLTISGSPGASA